MKSDEFAHSFAANFFHRLNNVNEVNVESLRCKLIDASWFCSNASCRIRLEDGSELIEELCRESDIGCQQLLLHVVSKFGITFLPNLKNGTRASQSIYGPIIVRCCGTLHKDQNCVGLFHEEFGLIQSPEDKTWKIKFINMNLKTCPAAFPLSIPPSLSPEPVFDIACF